MSPRKRKADRENWPEGLYKRKMRGKTRFFYRFRDKQEEYFDARITEFEAIQLGRRLEQADRNPEVIRQEKANRRDPFNIPLREAIPKVINCVVDNKELGTEKLKTFKSDCEKFVTLLGDVWSKDYDDHHVSLYLKTYVTDEGKSNLVYNTKLSFLRKVEKWLRDMSLITALYARDKAKRVQEDKSEQPLQIEHFRAIYDAAPQYLKIAMALSFQTTHAVQEMHKARYKDCRYFETPVIDEETGLKILGYMRIHRLKVEKKQASRVEIPITEELDQVIKLSRTDRIASPYIVHDLPVAGQKQAKECDHRTQCSRDKISKKFSAIRDSLDLELMVPNPNKRRGSDDPEFIQMKMADADPKQRPGFHGVRGLAMRMLESMGIDSGHRAGQTDKRSKQTYLENKVEYTRVIAANISFK